MLFHAICRCVWRSECGRYEIIYSFPDCAEEPTYGIRVDGELTTYKPSMDDAQNWCQRHANPVPELDHVGWDANGAPVR